MKRKNFPGRVKARQRVALEQVENRIKLNGGRSESDDKPEPTKDQKRQRALQAKEEKALLEKRI
jgi:hypothetical protein